MAVNEVCAAAVTTVTGASHIPPLWVAHNDPPGGVRFAAQLSKGGCLRKWLQRLRTREGVLARTRVGIRAWALASSTPQIVPIRHDTYPRGRSNMGTRTEVNPVVLSRSQRFRSVSLEVDTIERSKRWRT